MSIDANISKLYIIRCAKWFMLYMPIIGLFYDSHGLSATEIFLIQAAYSFSSALFSVPSGYFADVLGRKKTLIAGTILSASGFLWETAAFREPIPPCCTIHCNNHKIRKNT